MPQILASLEMLGMARMYTVNLMIGTNDSSRSSRTRLLGSAPMEAEEAASPTPQSSAVSSVVVVESKRVETPAETSRTR